MNATFGLTPPEKPETKKKNHEGRFWMIPLFFHFNFFFRNLVWQNVGLALLPKENFPAWGAYSKGGAQTYYFGHFSGKQHENEKKLDRKSGSLAAPP